MMTSICSEHNFPCELFLKGEWVPGSVYRKLTKSWCGLLRVEAFEEGGSQIWIKDDAMDFEGDFLELFANSGGENARLGPALRMKISVRMQTADGISIRGASYELGLEPGSPQPCQYVLVTLDGESVPHKDLDLSRIIDQIIGVECCGKCQFGVHNPFGGGDTMFGLHCFRVARDVIASREKFMAVADDMDSVAHPHTPLLHVCPSFQKWNSRFQH